MPRVQLDRSVFRYHVAERRIGGRRVFWQVLQRFEQETDDWERLFLIRSGAYRDADTLAKQQATYACQQLNRALGLEERLP